MCHRNTKKILTIIAAERTETNVCGSGNTFTDWNNYGLI